MCWKGRCGPTLLCELVLHDDDGNDANEDHFLIKCWATSLAVDSLDSVGSHINIMKAFHMNLFHSFY